MTPCPRCGASLPPERLSACPVCLLQADIPPAQLGEALELLEEIGHGGMGTVYKARHLKLGRTVAVKFLAEPLASQPDFRKRFEREARALAMLSHPGIVAVHDFGEEDDRGYIVMEYVEGQPLAERIPVPEAQARAIALQVCHALAYAHRQGVVHRDIKPANILVDAEGRVKISDFGVARLVGREPSGWTVTDPRGAVGTPHYMAPEALRGAPPDPRMDVYSLGVVLYEMVTGRRPVGHFDPLPGPLDAIVRRALAPEPERRYASAEEMRRDLEAASGAAPGGELGPDETNWLRAVALLLSLATAVALWAFLLSVTPRVVGPADSMPLVMVEAERLPDGRTVSWARFETGPSLAAVGMFAFAMLAHGLLRRHWREAGLERRAPDAPVREARLVLRCGLLAVSVYVVRLLAEERGLHTLSRYVPILGGAVETLALFFLWVAILQAWRTGRPLRREPRIWTGFALALCPPGIELLRYLLAWHP